MPHGIQMCLRLKCPWGIRSRGFLYFYSMEEFRLEAEYIPLISLLKALNWVESGGMAKMVVEDGLVIVNGKQELRKRRKLVKGDIVTLDKKKVKLIRG